MPAREVSQPAAPASLYAIIPTTSTCAASSTDVKTVAWFRKGLRSRGYPDGFMIGSLTARIFAIFTTAERCFRTQMLRLMLPGNSTPRRMAGATRREQRNLGRR